MKNKNIRLESHGIVDKFLKEVISLTKSFSATLIHEITEYSINTF